MNQKTVFRLYLERGLMHEYWFDQDKITDWMPGQLQRMRIWYNQNGFNAISGNKDPIQVKHKETFGSEGHTSKPNTRICNPWNVSKGIEGKLFQFAKP